MTGSDGQLLKRRLMMGAVWRDVKEISLSCEVSSEASET